MTEGAGAFFEQIRALAARPVEPPSPDPFLQSVLATEQIDRCAPYIGEHLDEWFKNWRDELTATGNAPNPLPAEVAEVGDRNAQIQPILNTYSAVFNHAYKDADPDVGKNLMSCMNATSLAPNRDEADQFFANQVGAGNGVPVSPAYVIGASPMFYSGRVAAFDANGKTSVLAEVSLNPGTTIESRREVVHSLVRGRNDGSFLWARTLELAQGDPGWVADCTQFRGN